ncbi:MAG TPA: glycosyltransferase [Pirellulaceae bacterium]|nr:glycosyltransferase [Pirellulaceae bacterium]
MFRRQRPLLPLADRGPLRAMFVITSMPVGGAETLLVNLIRGFDRQRIEPELCCLKQLGPLGEELATEIPTQANMLRGKYDIGVLNRLSKLLREHRVDALVTVGAGDKMFWGRLAAWKAGLPVILSALHSTGWPDGVGRLNRLLTPLTDGFIGVARPHGQYLIGRERFPAEKVFVIPNGVDVQRFQSRPEQRAALRNELGLAPDALLIGIVAALRPEKNHALFLQAAALVRKELPKANFVIVGDGPERPLIEEMITSLELKGCVHLLGTRSDTPQLLAAWDAFALTSHNEANPVSILEALACEVPVVATRVGSIPETVVPEETGFLATPGSAREIADHLLRLLRDPSLAKRLGGIGRERVVARWSLEAMVAGYTDLIEEIYQGKAVRGQWRDAVSDSISQHSDTHAEVATLDKRL